jgi:hypothetical protein
MEMSIYGKIKLVITELELADNWNLEDIDNTKILQSIKDTWNYLERYVKMQVV